MSAPVVAVEKEFVALFLDVSLFFPASLLFFRAPFTSSVLRRSTVRFSLGPCSTVLVDLDLPADAPLDPVAQGHLKWTVVGVPVPSRTGANRKRGQ